MIFYLNDFFYIIENKLGILRGMIKIYVTFLTVPFYDYYYGNVTSKFKMNTIDVSKEIKRILHSYEENFLGFTDDCGIRNDSGKELWQNDEKIQRYNGNYCCDNLHNIGRYEWCYGKEKYVYEGKFYANNIEGYGMFSYPMGNTFEGLFRGNSRYGPGVFNYVDGQQDVGLWNGLGLMRLSCDVTSDFVPSIANTIVGKAFLVQFKRLVSFVPKLFVTQKVLMELNGSRNLIEHHYVLSNKFIRNDSSNFFDKSSYDQRYFNDEIFDVMIITSFVDGVAVKKRMEVDELLAFNNEQEFCELLKFMFIYRNYEKDISFSVDDIILGRRELFGPPGELENANRDLIVSSALGNHTEVLNLLTRYNLNPDVCDVHGNTSLHCAAVNNHVSVMKILNSYGVNLDCLNDDGLTPLLICLLQYLSVKYDVQDWEKAFIPDINPEGEFRLWRPYLQIPKPHPVEQPQPFLLNISCKHPIIPKKSKKNKKQKPPKEKKKKKKEQPKITEPTPAEIEAELKRVALQEKLITIYNTIVFLLHYGSDPNFGEVPLPPLILSVFTLDENIVLKMIENGADCNVATSERHGKLTPLHVLASLKPSPELNEIAKILLKHHADVNIRSGKNHWEEEKNKIWIKPEEVSNDEKIIEDQNFSEILIDNLDRYDNFVDCCPIKILAGDPPTIRAKAEPTGDGDRIWTDDENDDKTGRISGSEILSGRKVKIITGDKPIISTDDPTDRRSKITWGDNQKISADNETENPKSKTSSKRKVLIDDDAKILTEPSPYDPDQGMTPIHLAAMRYDFIEDEEDNLGNLLETLIKGSDKPDSQYFGHNALSLAILRGNARLTDRILQTNRFNPNQPLGQNLGVPYTIPILKRYKGLHKPPVIKSIYDVLNKHNANPFSTVDPEIGNSIEFIENDTKKPEKSKKKQKKKTKKSGQGILETNARQILDRHIQGRVVKTIYQYKIECDIVDKIFDEMVGFIDMKDSIKILKMLNAHKKIDTNPICLYLFLKYVESKSKGTKKPGRSGKKTASIKPIDVKDVVKEIITDTTPPSDHLVEPPEVDDDDDTFIVCYNCLKKIGKTLIPCPNCEMVYFCSEQCNRISVKRKTKHPCKQIFYNDSLKKLEESKAKGATIINKLDILRGLRTQIMDSSTYSFDFKYGYSGLFSDDKDGDGDKKGRKKDKKKKKDDSSVSTGDKSKKKRKIDSEQSSRKKKKKDASDASDASLAGKTKKKKKKEKSESSSDVKKKKKQKSDASSDGKEKKKKGTSEKSGDGKRKKKKDSDTEISGGKKKKKERSDASSSKKKKSKKSDYSDDGKKSKKRGESKGRSRGTSKESSKRSKSKEKGKVKESKHKEKGSKRKGKEKSIESKSKGGKLKRSESRDRTKMKESKKGIKSRDESRTKGLKSRDGSETKRISRDGSGTKIGKSRDESGREGLKSRDGFETRILECRDKVEVEGDAAGDKVDKTVGEKYDIHSSGMSGLLHILANHKKLIPCIIFINGELYYKFNRATYCAINYSNI